MAKTLAATEPNRVFFKSLLAGDRWSDWEEAPQQQFDEIVRDTFRERHRVVFVMGKESASSPKYLPPPFPGELLISAWEAFISSIADRFEWAVFPMISDFYHDSLCIVATDDSSSQLEAKLGYDVVSSHVLEEWGKTWPVGVVCDKERRQILELNVSRHLLQCNDDFIAICEPVDGMNFNHLRRIHVSETYLRQALPKDIIRISDLTTIEELESVIFPGDCSVDMIETLYKDCFGADYSNDLRSLKKYVSEAPWVLTLNRCFEEFPTTMFASKDSKLLFTMSKDVPVLAVF